MSKFLLVSKHEEPPGVLQNRKAWRLPLILNVAVLMFMVSQICNGQQKSLVNSKGDLAKPNAANNAAEAIGQYQTNGVRQILDPCPGAVGTIRVECTVDLNGDGIKGPSDLIPLPGGVAVKFSLKRNGVAYDSTLMGNGVSFYTFCVFDSGRYTVEEMGIPAGWIQTLGGIHTTDIHTFGVADTARYLNFQLIYVSGMKFHDLNQNHINDVKDPGLEGWAINVSGSGGDSDTTDSNGNYFVTGLGPGSHTISEVMQPQWVQTFPSSGAYTFSAISGQNFISKDFGNYNTSLVDSSISGIKFADANNNGIKDAPDFGLANWKIVLFRAGISSPMDSAITDSTGFYIFKHLASGDYVIQEVEVPPWTRTYPLSGSYFESIDSMGTPILERDFGNYRLVTADTAKTIITSDVIAARADSNVLKAFQFHIPPPSPEKRSPLGALAADDPLPAGTVVYSWDSSVIYNVTRPKYFYWFDLNGDLKFGHACLYVFVDQATAEVESVSAQWWPVIKLPSQDPVEAWNSWDNRVTSPDIIHGNYGPGITPAAQHSSASPKNYSRSSTSSVAALTGTCAILVGGKAESPTELATWQHDLDSVRAALIYGAQPAVDSTKVLIENDITVDSLDSKLQQVLTADTLYFFFTGHGDTSKGGGIVLNKVGGLFTRVTLTYSELSTVLFDSLNLKRLNMLVDASNAGKSIDDFMKTKKPVVNLVTSTDAYSSAGSGLPGDTLSKYTKLWKHTELTVPLPTAVQLNWRKLNDSVRAANVILKIVQNPKDTTNAPLFIPNPTGIIFPDVAVGDSNARNIDVSNYGWISLDIDSINISDPQFTIAGSHTGTIVRNSDMTFPLLFKPTSNGLKFATVTFYHNGEISPETVPAAGNGILSSDTTKYRTFTQDSLAVKPIKKKPYGSKFCATFNNNTASTYDGIIVKFNMVVAITGSDSFPNPPTSGDGGKTWAFTGTTIPIGEPVSICGIGSKGKAVAVSHYYWTQFTLFDSHAKLKLSPATPPGQQLMLPMPTAGNLRDTVFRISNFSTDGLVIGVPQTTPLDKTYGWIRIGKSPNLGTYLNDKGITQTGFPRPFDTLKMAPFKKFVKQQKNLSPKKYSNHLAGELAALHFSIKASALNKTPIGLGELIYDDSTANPLNGLMLKTIADSADRSLTYRWGPPSLYITLDSVISKINKSFSGPIDTFSFGPLLRLKGVKAPNEIQFVRGSTIEPTRIQPFAHGGEDIPEAFTLYQNYPNPFNPTTTIEFDLPQPAIVTLKVYNVLGQEVATLLDHQDLEDGTQQVEFSAAAFASGVYFYRIVVEAIPDDEGEIVGQPVVSVRKMLLLK